MEDPKVLSEIKTKGVLKDNIYHIDGAKNNLSTDFIKQGEDYYPVVADKDSQLWSVTNAATGAKEKNIEQRLLVPPTTSQAGDFTTLPKTEASVAYINRLRPSQAGNISQYAVKDGEALVKDKQARADGFYQVSTPDGHDRFLLRYKDSTGQSNIYEVSHMTKLSERRANIIDPESGRTVLTLERTEDGWHRIGLAGDPPNRIRRKHRVIQAQIHRH